MPTYSEIRKITDPKEKFYAAVNRIYDLKMILPHEMTFEQEIELRNLESLKMVWYSEWKDPE